MKTFILSLALMCSAVYAGERDPRCPYYNSGSEAVHFAHETDCAKFYKCDMDGAAVILDCYDGLEFDSNLGVCL